MLLDEFRKQKKYVKFPEFLDYFLDKEQQMRENKEEIKPCFSCEKNGLPNCGNAHCVTREEK